MKALLTAFALLSFVAATTVPYVAQAATATTDQTAPKKKTTKKKAVKKTSAKKT